MLFRKCLLASFAMLLGGAMLLNTPAARASNQAAQQNQAPHVLNEKYTGVKKAMDELVGGKKVPGVLAQVVKNGEVWSYGAGQASIYSDRKMDPEFHFRIGSITKTFVATVMLQLAEEKKLSLDDSVEKWLPGVVQGNGHNGNNITIRQLLNHTSGIGEYTSLDFVNRAVENPYRTYSADELIRLGMEQKPQFEPGKKWSYTNTNYVLAGAIIQKVTGKTYSDNIEERIINKLGLKGTSVAGAQSSLPDPHARGYVELEDKQYIDITELNPSLTSAAGDMISTAKDLNVFFSALLGGKLLSQESLKQMLDGVETPFGRYGLGIYEITKRADGESVWGHSGGIHGFRSLSGGTVGGKFVMSANTNLLKIGISTPDPFAEIFRAAFHGIDKP
ncbi:beta-lactamase family protein [Paenibacillus alvei]|uniref:Beta-lactamase family protein n=1 Tax=Paenibacillus alvei TaxID=44250 RepID=A0ABT4GWL2_PAEAL|nr:MULTISPECIES: serine hydrolase domain-containing protein [Paenibacillus]MCY9543513.1 beta-lactamase family protein [Paenibacillus alvei]MCY9706902.1 beta-lactamase family protein [Paenibacillus alvei]MCY9737614.1 beta-lactamase family protein [Paenibacillus alvei]MCY9755601.1 beta-lactamase family protein [Paenibacillus alvei]MCY9761096.1 beta-lactamase family protein [Paenibacillus alvei]